MSAAGSKFFTMFADGQTDDWKALCDTWEYSHVARAALAMFSLMSLAIAATLYEADAD